MATYKGHNEDSSGNLLLSIGNGMTATVETGSTASQAYTKGAYIFFNNRFCKATSAIASGASLAIGTNLSETSVGAELTSHLRSSDGKEFYFDVKDGSYGYYPSASKTASEFVPFGGTSDYVVYSATTSGANNWEAVSIPNSIVKNYSEFYVENKGNSAFNGLKWQSVVDATSSNAIMNVRNTGTTLSPNTRTSLSGVADLVVAFYGDLPVAKITLTK